MKWVLFRMNRSDPSIGFESFATPLPTIRCLTFPIKTSLCSLKTIAIRAICTACVRILYAAFGTSIRIYLLLRFMLEA